MARWAGIEHEVSVGAGDIWNIRKRAHAQAFFGVFDGHGGPGAARYTTPFFPPLIDLSGIGRWRGGMPPGCVREFA